jgi:hypothetical protein
LACFSHLPLFINIRSEPSEAIRQIRYQTDDLGNWGAIVDFDAKIAAGRSIRLLWEGLVLASDSRLFLKRKEDAGFEWLSSTEFIQAKCPDVMAHAQKIIKGRDSVSSKVISLTDWTARSIQYGFQPHEDAVSVLKFRKATCLGFANVATAMARASGVPARSVSGYWVGELQETHWLNEFYLGEKRGWERVEIEGGPQRVKPHDFIPVRKVRVFEEFHWRPENRIPINSYPVATFKNDGPRVEAKVILHVNATLANVSRIWRQTKKEWQKDFLTLLRHQALPEIRQRIRSEFVQTMSTADCVGALRELSLAGEKLRSVPVAAARPSERIS